MNVSLKLIHDLRMNIVPYILSTVQKMFVFFLQNINSPVNCNTSVMESSIHHLNV